MASERQRNKVHRWMESGAHGAPGLLAYEWLVVLVVSIPILLITRTLLFGGLAAVGMGWLLLYGRRRHDGRREWLRLYLRRLWLPRHYRLLDTDGSYRTFLRGGQR